MSIILVLDYIIFFALIVMSIFWLLESNFSIIINFILIYLLIGVFSIALGFEFLGLLILLLYSTGVAVVFIIASMAIGTQHIKYKSLEKIPTVSLTYKHFIIKFFYNSGYYLSLIFVFFAFDLAYTTNFNISNALYLQSIDHILYHKFLTNLNDVLIIGILLFQEFFFYTILSGLLLTVSLVGSISVVN